MIAISKFYFTRARHIAATKMQQLYIVRNYLLVL